jgi:hypothetical protein
MSSSEAFITTLNGLINPSHGQSAGDAVCALNDAQLNLVDGNGSSLLIPLLIIKAQEATIALIARLSGEQILKENNLGVNALEYAIDSHNAEAVAAMAPKVGRGVIRSYDYLIKNRPELEQALMGVQYNGVDCSSQLGHKDDCDRMILGSRPVARPTDLGNHTKLLT